MKIKKGDNIIVISGKDKGKTGKVLKAFPKLGKVIVEGVNVYKKHERAKKSGSKGQVVDKTMPINTSNISVLLDGKKTKLGKKNVAGKYVRIDKKTGREI